MEKPNSNTAKTPEAQPAQPTQSQSAQPAKTAPTAPVKVPRMFRAIDWFTLLITFGIIWTIYLFTLAPEQTLEDSGELCTGAYYAGIPHPPGYPFWSVWAWFWTWILPIGNVAWRVEVGQSFAAAMGCGMLALMVSRGSSMLIEGIEELKNIPRRWENAICMVAGSVAGTLLGLDIFMWSESVVINRISIFGVPWLLAVVLCLMRWMYAPQQRRYLYLAMYLYGLCATIHQTLLLSAMGIEVAIALAHPKLGRDMLIGNSLIFLGGLMCMGTIPALQNMTSVEKVLFFVVGFGSMGGAGWLIMETKGFMSEWKTGLFMGIFWIAGVLWYLYEPISGMTVPPMQWGYPRTVEGFFHALSRGQYETAHGVDVFSDPGRFLFQIWYIITGLAESFSWVYISIGLLPFLFILKMHRRERSWIIGIASIFFCLSVLLGVLLNVSPERSSTELCKVFYTASHGMFAILIGYGLTLMAAYVATHYQNFRRRGIFGSVVAVILAVYCLVDATGKLYYGPAGGYFYEHILLSGIIFCILFAVVIYGYAILYRRITSANDAVVEKIIFFGVPGFLGVMTVAIAIKSPELLRKFIDDTIQFAIDFFHSFGEIFHSKLLSEIPLAFGQHQYGLPVIANLILIAIPVIFLCALLVYRQRGPVLILLCLAILMPSWSGLSHWYNSEQRNHWWGYWFGHDMFTPPFQDTNGKLSYDPTRRAELMKDPAKAKLIYPEMARDTILYGGTDPGRFCPTYAIFCDSFIPHNCQPEQDQKFDRRDVYIITQNALADGTYLMYLRSQYNRSAQIDPVFFSELSKYIAGLFIGQENSDQGLMGMINRSLYNTLDVPFTKWGAHVEKRRRAEGVYPTKEIYIPSQDDSSKCFEEYTQDVGRRAQLNQLKPGEDVKIENGRVQVSGQVAVMNINGLLCKVIFDHNPTNEFYIEESFPLDWMYPYETPFGIIMKINRNPLSELTQEVFDRDHKFWSDYSSRLCGNWITYDTTVKQICDFAERTYIRNNYEGYVGDPAFVRDDDAQKAFSKLRSSQAGMYAWRLSPQCPGEYRQKTAASQAALIRETDFAFKQAFAYCPYSPEAVYRYVNFLLPQGRFDDAILIAQTCQKLDPFNASITDLIKQLESFKASSSQQAQAMGQLETLENTARTNPGDLRNLLVLGGVYAQMQQTNRATEIFIQALNTPGITANDASGIAQYFAQIGSFGSLETALNKMVALAPEQPEARYDLAALQALTGKTAESLKNLKQAIEMADHKPGAHNLRATLQTDGRFNAFRSLPEFAALLHTN
jgi:tetratricopeptide (TPR) repeat protein